MRGEDFQVVGSTIEGKHVLCFVEDGLRRLELGGQGDKRTVNIFGHGVWL